MPARSKITKRSSMREVLVAYPSAQRALFRRFHIGGCNTCGYEPEDILDEVANRHKITDLDEVIGFIEHAHQLDQRMQVSPGDVLAALQSDTPPRLVDVRASEEWEVARIDGATLMTEALAEVLMRSPKDTPIIFYCHVGQRSLDAATYYAGHAFKNVRSMTGGIDAWSLAVDASVPRYAIAPEPTHDKATLRPLRSVVSQAAGCQK